MNNSLRLTVITLLLAVSNLSATTRHVGGGSPYSTIQQAVDASVPGDLILVSDGVYGGVTVNKQLLKLQSVNGPQFTVIDGGGANRCVALTNADGASLSGFTLTNGYANGGDGGGVWCASPNAFLTNCVIVGNSATVGDTGNGGNGGGAHGGTLFNCTLTDNSASGTYNSMVRTYSSGGGAFGCTLYNCTLTGNNATMGGGAYYSTLYNCALTVNWVFLDESGGYGGFKKRLYVQPAAS